VFCCIVVGNFWKSWFSTRRT